MNGKQLADEMKAYGFKSARTPKIINKQVEKLTVTERSVHNAVCKYLKLQYPNVMFLSDFGAGLHMTPGNAQLQNKQKSDHSFPDLMIFEQRGGYGGLFIEIKKDDSIFLKDGCTLKKDEHLFDQQRCMEELVKRGYFAQFGCGFDRIKSIIDFYLSLTK